jgi:hypothetical protein
MRKLVAFILLLSVPPCFGSCGNDDTTNPTEQISITTLLTGLEYPTGLWIKDGRVYFTETNGRNTVYGGTVALSVFDTGSNAKRLLVNNPVNSDAVVMDSEGEIYLASWHGAIPGDFGKVSRVDTTTKMETHVTDIEIAAADMYVDGGDNLTVIGPSDNPAAKSVLLLAEPARTPVKVIHESLGRAICMSYGGSALYYSDGASIKFFGAGNIFELFMNKSVRSMSFSSKYLFYADKAGGKIGRIALSNKADGTLASGLKEPIAVRWDAAAGKLYFLEAGTAAGEFKDGTLKVITGIL